MKLHENLEMWVKNGKHKLVGLVNLGVVHSAMRALSGIAKCFCRLKTPCINDSNKESHTSVFIYLYLRYYRSPKLPKLQQQHVCSKSPFSRVRHVMTIYGSYNLFMVHIHPPSEYDNIRYIGLF